jgi:predicted RNase H-related nuclease YkuK (DUF458 family)
MELIIQLGRETEDLKETRERLRKEVETAQNLTSRKERMLAGMYTIHLDIPADNQRSLSGLKKQKVKQQPLAVTNENWNNQPRNP